MPKALRLHSVGGPEALIWDDVPLPPQPGVNEIQIRHTAIGVNFVDVYHRIGFYKLPLPAVIGGEGVGIITAVGSGVTDMKEGDRIAYAPLTGAYAEFRNLPASVAVPVPGGVADDQAAAMMLKGLMAQVLIRSVYRVSTGDTVLIHAAAGGVGLILCQWAASLGATVIGTVGSREKADLVAANGCKHPILYREVDFVAAVKEITGGKGVNVVYDMVGKDTLKKSLDCLRTRGMLVSVGQASGPAEPVDVMELSRKGSLFLTRPAVLNYIPTRSELLEAANDLFDVVKSGKVKVKISKRYALKDAADAHRDLESRKTVGSCVLIP
jgi:NADPH2:quinone reductase